MRIEILAPATHSVTLPASLLPQASLAGGLSQPALPILQGEMATANQQREALILAHVALVRFVARRMSARLPAHVEMDDLISAGMMGLIDAASKFDLGKQVQFKSYAQFRIRGAILDFLRAEDWSPRDLRRKGRAMSEAIRVLSARTGRTPSQDEIAAEMQIGLDALQELTGDLKGLEIASLQEEHGEDSETQELDLLAAPEGENPLTIYLAAEQREQLMAALQALPERERLVLHLSVFEELTLKEIGLTLGVVESRVSQIRASALKRLQRSFRNGETGKAV